LEHWDFSVYEEVRRRRRLRQLLDLIRDIIFVAEYIEHERRRRAEEEEEEEEEHASVVITKEARN